MIWEFWNGDLIPLGGLGVGGLGTRSSFVKIDF